MTTIRRNMMMFQEIMQTLWRRLNDHGKQWRHVYKSLVLLEYLVKTGSEKVAQQTNENLFAIQTLKDFQFVDKDGKDQGCHIRERSKQLVSLLKDKERLSEERKKALSAKERFAQASLQPGSNRGSYSPSLSYSEDTASTKSRSSNSPTYRVESVASPANVSEEERQLRIAMELSKKEAAMAEKRKELEEAQLQEAMSRSNALAKQERGQVKSTSASNDPWGESTASSSTGAGLTASPWGDSGADFSRARSISSGPCAGLSTDTSSPWGDSASEVSRSARSASFGDVWPGTSTTAPAQPAPAVAQQASPWGDGFDAKPTVPALTASQAPWPTSSTASADSSPWPTTGNPSQPPSQSDGGVLAQDLFMMESRGSQKQANGSSVSAATEAMGGMALAENSKSAEANFLGENSNLVNLDNLAQPASGGVSKSSSLMAINPFVTEDNRSNSSPTGQSANPFAAKGPQKSLNEMRASTAGHPASGEILPAPLLPDNRSPSPTMPNVTPGPTIMPSAGWGANPMGMQPSAVGMHNPMMQQPMGFAGQPTMASMGMAGPGMQGGAFQTMPPAMAGGFPPSQMSSNPFLPSASTNSSRGLPW